MLVAASAFRDRLFDITFAFFIPRGRAARPRRDRGRICKRKYISGIPEKIKLCATNGKRIQSRQDSRPANSYVLLIRSKIRRGTKTKLYTARHPTPTDRTRLESRNSLYGTAAEQQSQHERRCKHAPLPRADGKEAGRMGYESSTIKHGRGTRMRIAGTGPCLRTTEDGAISRDKPARRATTSSPQRAELPLRGRRCRAPTAQACSARRWEA